MSEATAKEAVNQTSPGTPPEQIVQKPITQEYIDELKARGDRKGLDEAIQRMSNPRPAAEGQSQLSPADREITVNNDPQAVEKAKNKVFTTVVRGNEVKYDDGDNYLGYENFGKMKKSLVHAKEDIIYHRDLEKDARAAAATAIQEKEKIAQQLADTQKQMKDLENKIAAQSAVPPLPAVTDTPPLSVSPESTPLTLVDKPIPPKPLNVPADPGNWTEDDVKRNEEYQKEVTDFHLKSVAYMDYITELAKQKPVQQPPVVKPEIPAEYAKKVENLSEQLNIVTQKFRQSEEQAAAEEANRRKKTYWETIDSFKNQHKEEFGGDSSYDISSEEMSKQVLEWTDALAQTLGAKQPYTPFNEQDPEWQEYERQRLEAVNNYLEENPDTIKAVEGVESAQPPKGYKQYYDIVKVRQARDRFVADGILGAKATLHDAWVKMNDQNGTFDTAFSKVQTDTQANTSKQIFDHLQNQQAENATTIPNELQSPAPDDSKITVAERDRILGLSTDELARDPDLKKKHKMILTGELQVVA